MTHTVNQLWDYSFPVSNSKIC